MPRTERKDRIAVSRTRRKIDGDPADVLEVEHVESGEIVFRCFMGDDDSVERIADFLSAKRYPEAAMKVRDLVRITRRGYDKRNSLDGTTGPVGNLWGGGGNRLSLTG